MELNITESKLRDITQKELHDAAQKILDELREKIPPEIIENLKEELKKDSFTTFLKINHLYMLAAKNPDIGMLLRHAKDAEIERAKRKERLQKACMELEAKRAEKDRELRTLLAELKTVKEEYRELKRAIAQEIDNLVQQKFKELEESAQGQGTPELTQFKNKTKKEFQNLYEARIEEKRREIERLSQEIQRVRKEQNELKKEIHNLHEKIKLWDKYLEKYKDDTQFLMLPSKKSFSLPRFIKSLQGVNSEVRKINEKILSLADPVSSIPPESRPQVIHHQGFLLQAVAEVKGTLDTAKKSLFKLEKAIKNVAR